jgi:hypothetical protein
MTPLKCRTRFGEVGTEVGATALLAKSAGGDNSGSGESEVPGFPNRASVCRECGECHEGFFDDGGGASKSLRIADDGNIPAHRALDRGAQGRDRLKVIR